MKTIYTERDIVDMHAAGVTEIEIDDDVVLTDLAREKAIVLGLHMTRVEKRSGQPQGMPRLAVAPQMQLPPAIVGPPPPTPTSPSPPPAEEPVAKPLPPDQPSPSPTPPSPPPTEEPDVKPPPSDQPPPTPPSPSPPLPSTSPTAESTAVDPELVSSVKSAVIAKLGTSDYNGLLDKVVPQVLARLGR
jgi:outer membrane biosynthesis protein TonB